jgi:hypothetical protein
LRNRRVTLRLCRFALGDERLHLAGHFVDARGGGVALRGELTALQRQLRRVHRADDGAGGQRLPFLDGKARELAARLGRHHNLRRFDIAVRVRPRRFGATRCDEQRRCRQRASESLGPHHRTSRPSVVSSRALACASSTW